MKLPLKDSFFDMGCESWRGRNIGIKDWILVRRWHLVGYWGRWGRKRDSFWAIFSLVWGGGGINGGGGGGSSMGRGGRTA